MATKLATRPTLLDIQRAVDPDGAAAMVAEMMHKVNPIMDDMLMYEGNLQTGHQGSIRTGLPAPAWRLLNYPSQPTKSKRANVTDTCGILEDWGEIDEDVYELNGASDAFRLSEDVGHIEGIAQEIADTLFYGNTAVDQKKFLGLAPRYSSTAAGNGGQIILGGGSGADNTSIWGICWDQSIVHGIYPLGSQGGLMVEDLGIQTSETANGLMQVLRTHYKQKIGLHLKDWQGIVRIPNLDVNDMAAGTVDIVDLMITAYYTIPLRLRGKGMMRWYCNSTVKQALVKYAIANTAQNTIMIRDVTEGVPMISFWGDPIRECDAILNTEDLVA